MNSNTATNTTTPYGPDSALIVVDVQNDFVHPDGTLFVQDGPAALPRVNDEIGEAIEKGALVVYTQDWHPPDTPHFAERGGTWPPHCVRDTWGAQFHDDLRVVEGASVVKKGTGHEDGYSGFTVRDLERDTVVPTELDEILRRHEISRVTIVGVATDVCVKATALDALELGYPTRVIAPATAAVNLKPDDGDHALAELAEAGVNVVGALN